MLTEFKIKANVIRAGLGKGAIGADEAWECLSKNKFKMEIALEKIKRL